MPICPVVLTKRLGVVICALVDTVKLPLTCKVAVGD